MIAGEAVIYLGAVLPQPSSSLPRHACHFGKPDEPPATITRIRTNTWPCSVRGLQCLRSHLRSGGLLPHHFNLTSMARLSPADWRYVFCCAIRQLAHLLTAFALRSALVLRSSDFPHPPRGRDCPFSLNLKNVLFLIPKILII